MILLTVTLWVLGLTCMVDHHTTAFIFGDGKCTSDAQCFCMTHGINCKGFHFTSFPNLTTRNVPDDRFVVNLADNSLAAIPAGAFASLVPTNGTKLDLFIPGNQLTTIDSEAFRGIEDFVVWLYLDENELTEVPEALGHLTNLMELSVENNPISSLETSSSTLTNIGRSLQNLYISLSLFKEWPAEFSHLPLLQELYVSNVRLSRLGSDAFAGFESTLRLLSIDESEFSSVPEVICNLPNLEKFRFVNNGHLFSGPMFVKCPRHLATVKQVDLSHNHLRTMPNVFDMFPSVLTLDLSHNSLSDIEAGPIPDLVPLAELILNVNSLSRIPEALGKLPMLEYLKMEYNLIQALGDDDLSQFKRLTDLSLANNPLVSISDAAFVANANLAVINLEGTQLRLLPSSLATLPRLMSVNFYQDPLDCSCEMSALKSWDVRYISLTGYCHSESMSLSSYLTNKLPACP